MSRSVIAVHTAHRQQEGGGFIVRRPFPSRGIDQVDPFLMLDELGPIDYAPGEAIGAPDHPHRGFETVTYVLDGESEHEDSAGHRGVLRAGDVQWMTAGSGIVHSEMPSRRMQEEGGRMHGFQLWVNLPAKDKMMAPRYQELAGAKIPHAVSADGKAQVAVIAGRALGVGAVIDTRTPILYHHWTLAPGADVVQEVPADFRAFAYVFRGTAQIAGRDVRDGQIAVLGDMAPRGGAGPRPEPEPSASRSAGARGPGEAPRAAPEITDVRLASAAGAELLLLGGVPLDEPVARYGPFVMNTEAEIYQAVRDYQAGRMGAIDR